MTYQKVKLIERAPLSLCDKVDLLLIYANKKPATIIDVFQKEKFNPQLCCYELDQRKVHEVIGLLNKLKLPYGLGDPQFQILNFAENSPWHEIESCSAFLKAMGIESILLKEEDYRKILFGKRTLSKEDLLFYAGEDVLMVEKLPIFVGRNEEWKRRIIEAEGIGDEWELGFCYGYPETAVQAYLGEYSPFLGHFHDGTPLGFFTGFIQSSEYFEEELKSTSMRWCDTVKKLSKRLYEEIARIEENSVSI